MSSGLEENPVSYVGAFLSRATFKANLPLGKLTAELI